MTQMEKTIGLLCKFPGKWWTTGDFFKPEIQAMAFIGYEVGPRMSAINKKFPGFFEIKKVAGDQFDHRRVRFEAIDEWLPLMPKNLQAIVKQSQL